MCSSEKRIYYHSCFVAFLYLLVSLWPGMVLRYQLLSGQFVLQTSDWCVMWCELMEAACGDLYWYVSAIDALSYHLCNV